MRGKLTCFALLAVAFLMFFPGCNLLTGPTKEVNEEQPITTPANTTFTAVSEGGSVPGNKTCGVAEFRRDGKVFHSAPGCRHNSRGFSVAAINTKTAELLEPVRVFDTYWGTRTGEAAQTMQAMITFLDRLPDGTLVLVAVSDEAGLTYGGDGSVVGVSACLGDTPPGTICCRPLPYSWVRDGKRALESLGATQIQDYCYQNSWSFIAVKGVGSKGENRTVMGEAVVSYTLTTR